MRVETFVSRLLVQVVLAGTMPFTSVLAETVKIGIINTYSGPFAQFGNEMDMGASVRCSAIR